MHNNLTPIKYCRVISKREGSSKREMVVVVRAVEVKGTRFDCSLILLSKFCSLAFGQ
jgi:hypothetical protein